MHPTLMAQLADQRHAELIQVAATRGHAARASAHGRATGDASRVAARRLTHHLRRLLPTRRPAASPSARSAALTVCCA